MPSTKIGVSSLDPVVGVEDRGVNDRAEPLTRRICRIRRNERVDEDLVPFQHLVDGASDSCAVCAVEEMSRAIPTVKWPDARERDFFIWLCTCDPSQEVRRLRYNPPRRPTRRSCRRGLTSPYNRPSLFFGIVPLP